MSQALSYANGQCVWQVSDRLVTSDGNEFDPTANKVVVYQATNALIAINYSGRAYLEGLPTDRWIAEKLWGEPVREREPGRPVAMTQRAVPQQLDVGRAMNQLRWSLQTQCTGKPVEEGVGLDFAGWQWSRRRRRCRPLLGEIGATQEPNGTVGSYGLFFEERRWHLDSPGSAKLTFSPRGRFTQADAEDFGRRLPGANDVYAIRDLLVDTLRNIARRDATVGSDVVGLIIPHPRQKQLEIRYQADQKQVAIQMGSETYAAGFSPWLVGPSNLYAPSFVAGCFPMHLGGFTAYVYGPELGERRGWNLVQAMSSQKRRPEGPLA